MTKKQLWARIGELEQEIKWLENECSIKSQTIKEMKELPEGCRYGAYCDACIYGIKSVAPQLWESPICAYGACENFTPHAGYKSASSGGQGSGRPTGCEG